jgi:hypothetical protein
MKTYHTYITCIYWLVFRKMVTVYYEYQTKVKYTLSIRYKVTEC